MGVVKLFTSIIFLCLDGFFWNQVVSQRNGPVYTIVAPSKLRPNMDYHVSATLHSAPADVNFVVEIKGVSQEGVVQNVVQTVHVEPQETKVVDFRTDGWKPGNYSLKVSGSGGLTFENETELLFEHKSYSVFIQTDRAVYRPGQMVQFRSIVVDPSLLPAPQSTRVDLSVRDAHNNLIEEWKSAQTTNGVASAEFFLADQPVLGEWNVHVDVEGQKFKKHFDVAEFILPTYEVQIELPPYVTYNKSDVVARVKAMHSFGKPVKGEVTLTVAPRTRYNKLAVRPYESFQMKAKMDGTVDITLNLLHDLNLRTDFFKREIEFFALVEEEETGHKYNSTNTMWIYDKEIKVELIRTSDTFKPGLKYTAFLKVAYQDDTPASDNRNALQLKYGYTLREEEWKTISYLVPRNGIVKVELTPPNEDDINFLNMRATYQGQTYYIDRTYAALSPSNNFIQVALITPNPRVQQIIELEVNATEELNHLVYKVIGTGNIQIASTIPVPNQKIYRFSFRAPTSLAPRARVLVYYVRSTNNEIVADSVSFDVEGLFRTTVSVTTAVRETQPGNSVTVRLETKPNAFVGILGIDKGILQVKSGNDITKSDVIEELETYDGGQETKYRPPWYRRRRRSLSWPGSKSSGLIFSDSGAIILTNALVSRTGNEDQYPENAIYIDEGGSSRPIQPPSELPGAEVKEGRLVLRKKYPNTWLWINTTAGNDGTASISYTVPEFLTSWVISAFAIHFTDGLGISPATAEVAVYRPFFITMSLPYVVLMGESLAIQVVVFSYNKKTIQAEVTMENTKREFQFTAAGKDRDDVTFDDRRRKIVSILPSDGVPVSFLISPLKVGYIDIRVIASSPLAGDSLTKKLLVKPEGSTQNFNNASLIDFRNPSGAFKLNVSTVIPRNAIKDSGKIVVSTYGNLMAPMLEDVKQLLYVPVGCGEPNLVSFVPHLITLEYLGRINKLTPFYRSRAVSSLRNGYQRQLTYKREDGSFSTFGERDKSGSTWLTAFAVKSLHQAEPYIVVDHDVIDKGLQWIIKQQNSQGSFEEPGEVHHKALQGGAVNGAALTAFVLMSLLENQVQEKYGREMILAQRYIERELPSSKNPYVVAIITYALHLVDSPLKDSGFQMLLSLAERNDDGVIYWKNKEIEVNTTDKQSDYYFLAPSVDVETAAYALLTFSSRFDVGNGVSVLKWLISKQNKNGGFSSSQDTVVALYAISQMSPLMLSLSTNINVQFKYPDGDQKSQRITTDNAMEVQKIEVPSETPYLVVEANGNGVGVVQVSWEFNLAVSGEAPAFFLNALLDKTSTASYLQLSICTHQTNNEDSSNMAVMKVGLPSGYVADVDALPSILQIPKVKRVETLLEDTNVIIYFDRLDKEESCVTVPAHRIHKVANQKRAPVRVYDYYNQSQSSRMFYRPHKTVMCDICDDDDCGERCNTIKKKEASVGSNSASTWNLHTFVFLPVLLFIFMPDLCWKVQLTS